MVTKLMNWFDDRLPLTATIERHLTKYPAPINMNIWYLAGVLLVVVLVIQLASGIWLLMNYEPTAEGAFASIQYIMRDVKYGYIIRYMHTTGASAFFALIFLHMFRGMMYGSYQKPRELLWVLGWITYFLLCALGFTGYVLPWGQMSFWAAQVIMSLFGSIPYIGEDLLTWIRGDYLISGITLNRLFAFHVVLLPLALIAVVFVHILALHEVGSNNPDGGGYVIEYVNYEAADNLKTPEHIVPSWYYTPYYAMLRAVTFPLFGLTAKFLGFVVMAAGIAIFVALPWLDRSPVKSIKYKGIYSKFFLALFVVSFLVLGYLGAVPSTPARTIAAQIFTVCYFAYFLLMPIYSKYETCKPVPDRVQLG